MGHLVDMPNPCVLIDDDEIFDYPRVKPIITYKYEITAPLKRWISLVIDTEEAARHGCH